MKTNGQTTAARPEHPTRQTEKLPVEQKLLGGAGIRLACEKDAGAIVLLLGELGYPQTLQNVLTKIADLSATGSDSVFVAERKGELLAMAHLHVATLMHERGNLGRVMALVVRSAWRRQGVGRAMISALEEEAQKKGCTIMEITSSMSRSGAHRFYREMGYQRRPMRFVKTL